MRDEEPEPNPDAILAQGGTITGISTPAHRQPARADARRGRLGANTRRRCGREDLVAWYEQLVDISCTTFASGYQATAYHALAAALHVARDLDDEQRLEDIQILAQEQMRAVDAETPHSPLSTMAASVRGMAPLWVSLARQAETARSLSQAAQSLRR
jgi:hypothetical protein